MPRLNVALVLAGAAVLLTGCSHRRDDVATQLAPAKMTSIGVNSYLWRAALDTVSFAPLLTADSNGGVIITDWYVSPSNPAERAKITVTIVDQALRADALRVAVSRQINPGAGWVDAPASAATVQKLEDIILSRARTLRRTTIAR